MTADESDRTRVDVTVTGVVQAVGFRPFVYRRATTHDLAGSVRNTGDAGVDIALEGAESDIEAFLTDLRERPPPLSDVESVRVEAGSRAGATDFEIDQSTDVGGGSGTIPPDTGICEACLEDVRDLPSRYHGYWATSCVDCGPRYTVIDSLPYDRPRTSMADFPMCADCRAAYEDPLDRRYHAQTIACPTCGPSLRLLDSERSVRETGRDAIEVTSDRLAAGELVAIRGIGGTHLACLATDSDAVARLRDRTGRPAKPFALMVASLDQVARFAAVGAQDRDLLTDLRRPIVVLDRRRTHTTDENVAGELEATQLPTETGWLDAVTPGLQTVGVMLPYSGLHHLLFEHLDEPLVMTSANPPGQPMAISVDSIYDDLEGVIDAALVHDREIVVRCDDSVVRVVDGTPRLLRRSRGWVPRPLPRPRGGPPVLALGAQYDTVVSFARDEEVLPSQHLGDVDGPETEQFLRETVDHLSELFGVDPSIVACDLHPEFVTSTLAESYAVDDPVRVQHHHAHAAGLLAEHDRSRAIVVTADGTGYGPDETIWGGEVLDVTHSGFERVGGLSSFRLPGGDEAIRHPGRMLASLLEDPDRIDDLLVDRTPLSAAATETLRESLAAGVNAPATTSAGRFLDAVSALLGVSTRRRYQGEPALRLEAAAAGAEPIDVAVPYGERDGQRVVDVQTLIGSLDDLSGQYSTRRVAATAQSALARGLAAIALESARERDVDAVGFTGGVAYNDAISQTVRARVGERGLRYLENERVPPGDAGISYGQTVVATAKHRADKS